MAPRLLDEPPLKRVRGTVRGHPSREPGPGLAPLRMEQAGSPSVVSAPLTSLMLTGILYDGAPSALARRDDPRRLLLAETRVLS